MAQHVSAPRGMAAPPRVGEGRVGAADQEAALRLRAVLRGEARGSEGRRKVATRVALPSN